MALSLNQLEDEQRPLLHRRTEAEAEVRRLEQSLAETTGADQLVARMALNTALATLRAIDETLHDLGRRSPRRGRRGAA